MATSNQKLPINNMIENIEDSGELNRPIKKNDQDKGMVSKSLANPIPQQFSPKNLNNNFMGDAGGSSNLGATTATGARNSSSNPDGLNNYNSAYLVN